MNEKLQAVIDGIAKETEVPSIVLQAECKETSIFGSKLGGNPYYPADLVYPRNRRGEPLKLLAQLNFGELPELQDFPQRGILQFFIANNVLYGADLDHPTEQDDFRVVYHQEILGRGHLLDDFPDSGDRVGFPVRKELALTGMITPCPVSLCDYRFSIEKYNQEFGTNFEYVWNLPEGDCDDLYDAFMLEEHRIGGYPVFTQDDPRYWVNRRDLRGYDTLLLQITSDEDNEIMWGDMGLCNFFINKEKLRSLDFSDVLYNWDCS